MGKPSGGFERELNRHYFRSPVPRASKQYPRPASGILGSAACGNGGAARRGSIAMCA